MRPEIMAPEARAASDLNDFLPYLLNRAAEAAGQDFRKIYKARYGMLRAEWRVLFHLGTHGAMTATEIGRRAALHKTKVSRAVQKLEARRFLRRERLPADRRFERLVLTPSGNAACRDLRAEAVGYDARLAARLSPAEARLLRDMLKRLAAPL